MEKLTPNSPDLTEQNIDKLAELFPNVVTETKNNDDVRRAIDFDLLRQELADHVVEGPQERYQLDWPGKRQALLTTNASIAKTLRPVREESVDFDSTKNLFIEGDNLDALKLLQESYLGKVKLIYIDPPYNTGNDFVYEDDFAETSAQYLESSGAIDEDGNRLQTNLESAGRFHSNWLTMMYPRLRLARNLMTDDGLIFVSLDDHEVANLRSLMDEVFGAKNFVGQFVWKKGGTGKNDSQFAVVEHEYVLSYARNASKASFGLDPDAKVSTSYNRQDSRGKYSLVRLDSKTLGYVESLDFVIVGPDGTPYSPEQPEGRNFVARWRWSEAKVEKEYSDLVFEKGFVYTKNYEKLGARPRSLLAEERFGVTRTGRAEAEAAIGLQGIFDFPKPVRLIRHLIRIADDEDLVVLDFFSGSGTTAQAVFEQNLSDGGNRKFIMIQIPEATPEGSNARTAGFSSISQIALERIRRAGAALAEKADLGTSKLDVGFRMLTIGTTSMADVELPPDETDQLRLDQRASSVKANRSGEDLLFQVVLDWGLALTMPIVVERIDGHEVFVVEEGSLVACFEQRIDSDLLHSIAKREPLRAVFRDSSFGSDAERINAEQVFNELSPATDVKVI